MSRASSERLMCVQFTSCVYGVVVAASVLIKTSANQKPRIDKHFGKNNESHIFKHFQEKSPIFRKK